MFEPLLFFVFTSKDNFFNVPLSIARLLQVFVLLLLVFSFTLKLVNNKKLIFVNNLFSENRYLLLFFIISVFAGFFGLIYGSYNLPPKISIESFSGISPFFFRSLFEYFILLFNIIYFVILPRHLIKTKIEFDYLFSVFKYFLIASFFFGYVDYLLSKFDIIDLIGRHIRDGLGVGDRFHGLGGEPRQATAHIIFNISMYILYCKYFNITIKTWVLLLLILALPLSLSMSFVIAVIFFVVLLFIFRVVKLNFILIILPMLFFMLSHDRIGIYVNTIKIAWQIIDSGIELPYEVYIVQGEIYPIYNLVKKFQNFELISIFFGNGLGSASVINNIYIDQQIDTKNPNIQIIRLLFETGILGTIVFVKAMIWPIKYYTRNVDKKTRNLYLITMLLVLSISLSVRSPIVFIYLGILTSFLNFNVKKIKH
jgi:hypothetical protein